MLGIGAMCLVLVALCFSAGFLLFPPARPSATGPAAAAPEAPAPLVVAPPEAAKPATHKYNITIETTADWSRAILHGGTFTSADAGTEFNAIEMISEAPEQAGHFVYSPGEVSVNQIPFAHARIVIKGVVESELPTLEVRLGHGDNGYIIIRSPIDSFINDRTLGDGQNFVTGSIRLE